MGNVRHYRLREGFERNGPRIVGVFVALFVVGVLFLSAHVSALRHSLELHVGGLRSAQQVQRMLVSGAPRESLYGAVSELRSALGEIVDRTASVNDAASRLGSLTLATASDADRAEALDGLVSALRNETTVISNRLGATWTWLAAYAVAAIALAGLAWWLSRQIQGARVRAEELFVSLQTETAERLLAEEQRHAHERLLTQIVQHAPVAISIHDPEGRLLRRNSEHMRLFGSSRGPTDEALERARRGETSTGEERVVQRPGVSPLIVDVAASPVPGANGGIDAVVVFARDVTEARRQQQEAWAEDRAKTVATLARGMGHELRNPLTFVLGNIAWLLDEVREHASAVPEERRLAWEQALVDMGDGASRLRGAAMDLGALGGRNGGVGGCDPCEALRLAARLVSAEMGDVARVVVEPSRAPLVAGNQSHIALLLSDVLRRVASLLRASGVQGWLVRLACEGDQDGALIRFIAESANERTPLPHDQVDVAFGAAPNALIAPLYGLLSQLGATLDAVPRGDGLCVSLTLPPAPQEPAPQRSSPGSTEPQPGEDPPQGPGASPPESGRS